MSNVKGLALARVGDRVFNANHTYTPRALRGQGIAGKLYDAMITDAKAEGYKIIPGCPYIEVKFKRHPEDRACLLYTSPSPRDATLSRMPSSA